MAVVGNSAGEIGDELLSNSTLVAIDGILNITGFEDSTINETTDRFFDKEFRYAVDGGPMGAYIDLKDESNFPLEFEDLVSISVDFKYTRAGTDATDWLYFNSVKLVGPYYVDRRSLIERLFERFYPKGFAFKIPFQGIRYKINKALTLSENRAYSDAVLSDRSILADSKYFGKEDADLWELRLGIPNGSALPIETRRENILRKYAFPGTIIARANYRYVERELRKAGFDVYVHENRFPDGGGGFETKNYQQFVNLDGFAVHYSSVQLGFMQLGERNDHRAVNYLDPILDDPFNIVDNLERTFFIGAETAGEYAEVSLDRKEEFRKLILTLKPTQTLAYLVVNFV